MKSTLDLLTFWKSSMAFLSSCWRSLILVLGSLISLGEVVVMNVDLRATVGAEFEDLFDAVACRASEIISRTLAFIWALSGASPLVSLATMERTAR